MLVAHGLGKPGGLLVSGGLGQFVLVPIVWAPPIDTYHFTVEDHATLLVVDLAALTIEDHLATLFYDRGPELFSDIVLTAIDPHEMTDHETIELRLDPSPEVHR